MTALAPEPGISAREALSQLRTQAPNRETIYYVYVIDDARHLHGFVSLRKLFLAKPEALKEILFEGSKRARVTAKQTMERVRDAMRISYR